MNVLGQQNAQNQQQGPGTQVAGSVGGAPDQGGMPQSQPPQTQPAPGAQGSQGSGMFRDLRKYVQSNTPSAQKMGQAITTETGKQASQIGQQVNQQKQQLQQRLDENNARVQGQQTFGQQQLQTALGTNAATAEENDKLTSEQKAQQSADIARFQNILSGRESYADVGSLDIGAQQAQAAKIAQLGKMAERTPARRELLQQTFSKTGPYQGGQKTLDDLILQAGGAISGIKQGVSQQGQAALGNIRDVQQQASTDMAALGAAQEATRKGLQTQLSNEQTALQTAMEERAKQENETYANLVKGLQAGQLTQEQADLLGLKSGQLIGGNINTDAQTRDEALALLNNARGGTSLRHFTGNLAEDQYSQLVGGIDYAKQLAGIEATAGNTGTADEIAKAQALGRLGGVDPAYLTNIDIGGYAEQKQSKVDALKKIIAQGQQARDAALKQGSAAQIYGKFFGDPGQVSDWTNQYANKVQYVTDPSGVQHIRYADDATGEQSNQLDAVYQQMQDYTNKAFNSRNLAIGNQAAADGGIMRAAPVKSKEMQAKRDALRKMAASERYVK